MADRKNTANSAIGVGIVGAAMGAAVGAAAVALSDPKTRKKAIRKIGEVKKKTATTVANIKAEMTNTDDTDELPSETESPLK